MAHCEFLIQKEGEDYWHPFSRGVVELEENRYRVVAHTSKQNAHTELKIIYTTIDAQGQTKQKIQKRSRRTNEEGFMAILPYTHLKPGSWEIRLKSDVMSDFLGDSWEYDINFKIDPCKSATTMVQNIYSQSGLPDDLTQLDPPTEPEPAPPAELESEASILVQSYQVADDLMDQLLSPVLKDLEDSQLYEATLQPQALPSTPALPWFKELQPNSSTETQSDYENQAEHQNNPHIPVITLLEDSYICNSGDLLTLTGEISLLQETIASIKITAPRLQILLRDPQNSMVLVQLEQLLTEEPFPFPFSCTIKLPPNSPTRVILGEIILSDAKTYNLANQYFNITVDIDALVSILGSNIFKEPESQTPNIPIPQEPKKGKNLDLTFLNLVSRAKPIDQSSQPNPNPNQPPPPPLLINQQSIDSPPVSPPSFPSLPSDEVKVKEIPIESNFLSANGSADNILDNLLNRLTNETPNLEVDYIPSPNSEIEEQLKLAENFWNRMNSLNEEATESDLLLDATDINDTSIHLSSEPLAIPQNNIMAQEVVVDDIPISNSNQSQTDALREKPLPAPILEVVYSELIAGQIAWLKVQLPSRKRNLHVKVWAIDRQTLSLIYEPAWVVGFQLNNYGFLETTLQLMIPPMTQEIRFEAITVDTKTQQESNKVVLQKKVMIPLFDEVNQSLTELNQFE